MAGDRDTAARICLDYYDSAYGSQLTTRFGSDLKLPTVKLNTLDSKSTIEELKSIAKDTKFNI
jgi:hypothetical protein